MRPPARIHPMPLLTPRRAPARAVLAAILSGTCSLATAAPPSRPAFTPPGGLVRSPALLQIANPDSAGTIFYTIDGPDPRDVFGSVVPEARASSGPLSIRRSMTIRARVRRGAEWSNLAAT